MQITPSIHALRHSFKIPIEPGVAIDRFVYSYIIYGEMITLIDTGVAGCESPIFENILSAGRDPSEISLIILTHSHPDHIGSAGAIQRLTGCSVAAHPTERAWIEDVRLQDKERPVPGFATLVGGPITVDHELADGDTIEPDETRAGEMIVFHTPGHSKGSISLFLYREGALFSGDAVPVSGEMPIYEDAVESVKSVKKLLSIPGIRILFSSWDEPRAGDAAYKQMERALEYLNTIQKTVLAFSCEGICDPTELTRKTVSALGLPPEAANPLLSRTFAANLRKNGEQKTGK
jgi:glyoxylase-like metal-dependent hydrolase (beta-lactamase superfamily II)